jgi:hypothetical protein
MRLASPDPAWHRQAARKRRAGAPRVSAVTSVRGLVAAVKIHCEFLTPDRWQVEGKQCSVRYGGCGAPLMHDAICLNTDLLRESLALRHSRHKNLILVHNPG